MCYEHDGCTCAIFFEFSLYCHYYDGGRRSIGEKMIVEGVSAKESLLDLAGGCESSVTFSGDLLEIQKRLRNEWE